MINPLVGTWSGTAGAPEPVPLTVEFRTDNSYTATQSTHFGSQETVRGTYRLVADNGLEVTLAGSAKADSPPSVTEALTFTLRGDMLILRDQQAVDMTLIRQHQ